MEELKSISIDLSHFEKGLQLFIYEHKKGTLFVLDDAFENNEAKHQLIEGFFYDYEFSFKDFHFEKDQIVQPHSRNKNVGTIAPNIFVGTLSLPVFHNNKELGNVKLEVQSIKASYRTDYRDMLELITEKCTDLLMQSDSPVSHKFETDFTKDNETLYQKFAFIKSIISTDEFSESIHRIVSAPVTQWKETTEFKDIRQVRRFKNSNIKELVAGSNRTGLPVDHFLQSFGLDSLPNKISSNRKIDTVDTPENRFIKHVLEVFLKFCTDINKASKPESRLFIESNLLVRNLESYLHHSFFKEISSPNTLKINSPVLQRKEGYREVLRVWLMFDLAAKLVWKGGEDIYSGGKKDIAVLYEYWLFFKLLELFQSIFNIEPKAITELIKETDDGLNLQLKQGVYTALSGVFDAGTRKLNIRFNYNRSFSGQNNYPHSGSWTNTMRPDYTLSFWPHGINESVAEKEELIVHIHFDAKYKVANLIEILNQEKSQDLDIEKTENRNGVYKNADLLKMHAYKDAIRRTGGAYILYPGDKSLNKKGFHEIIPGLGAFPVRPSKTESGTTELKAFIYQVIDHFLNRASQREKLAYKVYDIHKENKPNEVRESFIEAYGKNRALIPDDTFVLVGYYNSPDQYNWIVENKLYNFRMGSGNGSLILDKETVDSKYLLLHTIGDDFSCEIWRIVSKGPKVYSKQDLINKGYRNPSQDYYLVIEIEKIGEDDFKGLKWKFKELSNYLSGRASAFPFTTSLTELMNKRMA
jgi:predicted component of viral defense system (DUF524 family)